jgi:hypothetical protein
MVRSVGELRIRETETAMGEAATRRAPIQIADLAARSGGPLQDASLAAGYRGVLIVPWLARSACSARSSCSGARRDSSRRKRCG